MEQSKPELSLRELQRNERKQVCYDVYVCDGVEYVMEEGFGRVHFIYLFIYL